MKLKELVKSCSTTLADIEITGITCDSRNVQKGNLFVCIDGAVTDGHKYAQSAIEKGAAAVLVEKDLKIPEQILVSDTHKAFSEVSAAWFGYPASRLKLIGVTGTNGKTSVTYMLKAILESLGHKVGLVGTIQNMICDEVLPAKNTTPNAYELNSLFSLMEKAGCKYAIMEVSSHALDQKRVCGIEFEVGIFTNLTRDHLDYHITMDNYFEAKKKLFSMCKCAVVNFDDEYGKKLLDAPNIKTVSYSLVSDMSTYTAKNIEYYPDGVCYQMVGYNLIGKIKLSTGGRFTVYNSMCAASAAIELGIDLNSISTALSKMPGVKGRAESVNTGRDFNIIIDYAHTPDGLKNILRTFKECKGHRIVALFGCGGDRDKTKRPLMGEIAAQYSDYVIVTSDNPRSEEPSDIISDILVGMEGTKTPYTVIENRIDAIKFAIANAKKNDIIVLAGKGHETYQILKNGTIHLDEREVIAEALKENEQ